MAGCRPWLSSSPCSRPCPTRSTRPLSTSRAPLRRAGSRLVVYLFGDRLWLFGSGAQVGAFVFQALALRNGLISVVQPLLATGLVFMLVLRRFWDSPVNSPGHLGRGRLDLREPDRVPHRRGAQGWAARTGQSPLVHGRGWRLAPVRRPRCRDVCCGCLPAADHASHAEGRCSITEREHARYMP